VLLFGITVTYFPSPGAPRHPLPAGEGWVLKEEDYRPSPRGRGRTASRDR